MAETARGTKFVKVSAYTRADGTKVPAHDRSTPDTSSLERSKQTPATQACQATKPIELGSRRDEHRWHPRRRLAGRASTASP